MRVRHAKSWVFRALLAFASQFAVRSVAVAETWPDLSHPPAGSGSGANDAVVLIGVENYDFVSDIPGATINIRDWQSWFLTTRGVPAANVIRRLDGDAVDDSIREAAQIAAKKVGSGGTLWFVYVGHGASSADGREPLLVGADARNSPAGIYGRSVAVGEIEEILVSGGQSHTVLVLDACFSGQGVDGSDLVSETLAPLRVAADGNPLDDVSRLLATSDNQYAGLLPGASRPAFSYLVLGALRGWGDANENGRVSANEAVSYASGVLNLVVTGRQQEPRLVGPDLSLSRGLERGPDLAAFAQTLIETDVSLSGKTDFARAARAASEKEEIARRLLAEAEQERAAAAEQRRLRMDVLADAVREQAARDWGEISPYLHDESGDETRAVVAAFVKQYGSATVHVGDSEERVDIPEVETARRVLSPGTATPPSERSEASRARVEKQPSKQVPWLAGGGIAVGAGLVSLVVGGIVESNIEDEAKGPGGMNRSDASARGTQANVAYGLGYALMLGGATASGIGLTLTANQPAVAISWTAPW